MSLATERCKHVRKALQTTTIALANAKRALIPQMVAPELLSQTRSCGGGIACAADTDAGP